MVSRSIYAHKLRTHFDIWVIPMMNPDGIVIGNYRCTTQGKDMNRFFTRRDDPDAKVRIHEVDLLVKYLKENIPKS